VFYSRASFLPSLPPFFPPSGERKKKREERRWRRQGWKEGGRMGEGKRRTTGTGCDKGEVDGDFERRWR